MKNKKKSTNKNIESSPILKFFECGSKKSNSRAILNYLNEHTKDNTMKSLMPKGLITHQEIASQTKLSLPEKPIPDIIAEKIVDMLKNSNKSKKITIYLTSSGTLYRNIKKERLEYNAHNFRKPLEIFKFLNTHNYNLVETPEITKQVGCLNDKATRKAIGKFNSRSTFRLNLGIKIIKQGQPNGYKINPIYIIENTEE